MCGIAGFNASPEWVATHLNEDNQYAVLEKAWLFNQHRGEDAAGYFRIDAEEEEPYVRKAPIAASDMLLENKVEKLSPALVLGAHTRAATRGAVKNKLNNHPVEYRKILVTHNGTITNHAMMTKTVPEEFKDQIGEVDTAAIAVALNRVDHPLEIQNVISELAQLRGNMAIHAVWKPHPGYSVLARGEHSPLHIRMHPEGIVVYGSEDESTFEMIAAMGVDPNDKDWIIRSMDEYSVLVVHNGRPVKWGSYKNQGWTIHNRLPYTIERVFKTTKVAESDYKKQWAADAEHRSLSQAKGAKKTKLMYSAKTGFSKASKIDLPITNRTAVWDKLVEADLVYAHENDKIVFAKFGDIELVLEKSTSKLLDAYDHSKFKGDRYVEEDKEPIEIDEDDEPWSSWFTKSTTNVFRPVTKHSRPKFMNAQTGNVTFLPNPSTGGVRKAFTTPDTENNQVEKSSRVGRKSPSSEEPYDPDIIDLGNKVGWEDHGTFVEHLHAPMGLLYDLPCPEHNDKLYSEHVKPTECERVILASIAFASAISDITLWYTIDPSLDIVLRKAKTKKGQEWQCDETDGIRCDFHPYLWRQVWIGKDGDRDQAVEVMMGEMCSMCGTRMYIQHLPDYMEVWTGDKHFVA
jgi:hypothetical protein